MLLMNRADIKKQSGAVLVMALVMLTVLTLIGVASMESSSMELKVAGNIQEHDVAFQSAQTIIAFILSGDLENDGDPTNDINWFDISATPQIRTYLGPGTDPATGIVDNIAVTNVGCAAGIGDSIEEGKGQKFNFYNAQVTGFNKQGSSNSVQVQGVRYYAAGCG